MPFDGLFQPVDQIDAKFLLVADHLLALLDLRHVVRMTEVFSTLFIFSKRYFAQANFGDFFVSDA